ncbi:MAG: DUF47 family protein, partial [Erysipelotrichia bacterium]|nr:DUF47 family protein [Erysipelotrichia bacterium]
MAKKYDYFNCFTQMSKIAFEQANLLSATLNEYSQDTIQEKIAIMHNLERDADQLRHELLERLLHEFLPPFDHEDITNLIERLDDVCDTIDDVLMRFYMYDIHTVRSDVENICQGIIDCTNELSELVEQFKNYKKEPKPLLKMINDVNKIEEIGDSYYMESTHKLFCSN